MKMRTYIFTKMEEEALKAYVAGELTGGRTIHNLKYMFKKFKRLRSHVELYLKALKAFGLE